MYIHFNLKLRYFILYHHKKLKGHKRKANIPKTPKIKVGVFLNQKYTTMKKVLTMFATLSFFYVFSSSFTDDIYIHPLQHNDGVDYLFKSDYKIHGLVIELTNKTTGEKSEHRFRGNSAIIENIDPNHTYTFNYFSQYDKDKQLLIEEASELDIVSLREIIFLNKDAFDKIAPWFYDENQSVKLSDHFTSLYRSGEVSEFELLSFAQRHLIKEGDNTITKNAPFEENLKTIIAKSQHRGGAKGGPNPTNCRCTHVLNAANDMVPLTAQNSRYNVIYNIPNTRRARQARQRVDEFISSSGKWWHRLLIKKGPAHVHFLRNYDNLGSHRRVYSSMGNSNISTDVAYIKVNFLCNTLWGELPQGCACLKRVRLSYQYDAALTVITRRLRPLTDADAVVEEAAILTHSNPNGAFVLAGNNYKIRSWCRNTFNWDWLTNFGALAAQIYSTVTAIQGSNFNASHIDNLTQALVNLLSTTPIDSENDCNDGRRHDVSLLQGSSTRLILSNQPNLFALHSFTYLGVEGGRRWDNYAVSRSGFKMTAVVDQAGWLANADWCCSNKYGAYLLGSVPNAPLSEGDYRALAMGAINAQAPWGPNLQPAFIPNNANEGYFVWNDHNQPCAPVIVSPLEEDNTNETHQLLSVINIEEKDTNEKLIEQNNVSITSYNYNLSVYPNPARDITNINIDAQESDNLQIRIIDMKGRIVTTLDNNNLRIGNNVVNISNNSLQNGIYFVVLSVDGKVTKTEKLIINQ